MPDIVISLTGNQKIYFYQLQMKGSHLRTSTHIVVNCKIRFLSSAQDKEEKSK